MQTDRRFFAGIVAGSLMGFFSASAGSGESFNLLRNASFEYEGADAHAAGAFHWMLNDPDEKGDSWGSASRESWRAKQGHYAGTIRGRWAGQGGAGGWWQDSPATSEQTYRFTGWFFADPEWTAGEQFVKLEFRDQANNQILGEVSAALNDIGEQWTEVTLSSTAPSGTAFVRLVIHASDVSDGGALQFDYFSLVAVD